MASLYCYFPVPVNYHQDEKSTYLPLTYDGFTYFIDNKKFYYVLSSIDMLDEFLDHNKGSQEVSISKWMSSKDLFNEGLLESISKYRVKNNNLKRINDYKVFSKDNNCLPDIEQALKSSFSAAVLHDFIFNKKDRFNSIISNRLQEIQQDLMTIKDTNKREMKKKFCRDNIFKILLNYFLVNIDEQTDVEMEKINLTKFSLKTDIHLESDVDLYRVADIKKYTETGFKVKNITQRECLKEKTLLKIDLNQKRGGLSYIDFEKIQQKALILTKHKLDFEKSNILSLVSKYKNIESLNDGKIESYEYKSEGNQLTKVMSKKKTSQSLVDLLYYSVEIANCIIGEYGSLLNLAVFLNLETSNIQILKELFYQGKNDLESQFINFSFKKAKDPFLPIGYGKIDYM